MTVVSVEHNAKRRSEHKSGDGMVRAACKCGKRLKVELRFADRTAECPKCGSFVTFIDRLPEGAGENPADIDWESITELPAIPENETTPAPSCRHLSPLEAVNAIRRHNVDAALQVVVSSFRQSRRQDAELEKRPRARFADIADAAWLWPVAAAMAATCAILIMLAVVTS